MVEDWLPCDEVAEDWSDDGLAAELPLWPLWLLVAAGDDD